MRQLAAIRQSIALCACRLTRHRSQPCRLSSTRRVQPAAARAAAVDRQSLLFVAPVWPERSSSAAGVRTAELIGALAAKWDVHFLSPCKENQHSRALVDEGVAVHCCPANREELFIRVLQDVRPQVCVFDRHYAEEAFSFHVQQQFPGTLRILDMQDMHALRQGRMERHQDGATISEVLAHRPVADSTVLLRELASIYRSDLTLVCSPVELQLLRDYYGVPAATLALAPLFVPPPPLASGDLPSYGDRRHFVSIGNFKHPPNLDSVQWLAGELWDAVRARLGDASAELHLYGAYPTHAVQRLHDPARKLFVKGHMPSLSALRDYRVSLAPLRFGAGLKGKVVDSWAHGLPVVTTAIGSEGMHMEDYVAAEEQPASLIAAPWGGFGCSLDADTFAEQAAALYTDQATWQQCQDTGLKLLETCFAQDARLQVVEDAILRRLEDLPAVRQTDFVGHMLWQQGNRATEYFSRWIEMKETQAGKP